MVISWEAAIALFRHNPSNARLVTFVHHRDSLGGR
jgi:hypothetical protein